MQVREIMTQNPAYCTPDSTLQEIAKMMKDNDCGCIPVVNNHQDRKPVGTITDRDITIRTVAASQNPVNMKALDIMTTDIATVNPQTSIEECFRVMEDREIRRVIVVDEQGKCCGIVAQADVVQSNANPVRTNKVIREISESAPSPNRGFLISGRNYEYYSNQESFMSSNYLLPLLVGLGSGLALMYFSGARGKSSRPGYIGNLDSGYESDFLNATDEESFGKYTDAEKEIENRQRRLEERVRTRSSESNFPVNNNANNADFFDTEDETITNRDKGRTATPGKF